MFHASGAEWSRQECVQFLSNGSEDLLMWPNNQAQWQQRETKKTGLQYLHSTTDCHKSISLYRDTIAISHISGTDYQECKYAIICSGMVFS
jgi:hypothetical protein